jgi:hypothetical protein
MTNQDTNKKDLHLKQSSGNWASGKVDKTNPDIKKDILATKELQAKISQQREVSIESLKRVVSL